MYAAATSGICGPSAPASASEAESALDEDLFAFPESGDLSYSYLPNKKNLFAKTYSYSTNKFCLSKKKLIHNPDLAFRTIPIRIQKIQKSQSG